MWEPLYCCHKAKEFVDNLVKKMRKDQIIIYKKSGPIGNLLASSLEFKRCELFKKSKNSDIENHVDDFHINNGIYIFVKK